MKRSYIDYAMSVIVSRALPDVRDGLKPVHRRILYAMLDGGNTPDKPFKKSARTVGDVLGKYHPHGDVIVYDALVRMAQPFSLRYPLIEGHGNFGSIDGDPPAAMRYTEARLERIALEMLRDIDKKTVDFAPNFDESTEEPRVLPARFPNLLVNGSVGIAVGMATSIPPHNLREVVDACVAMIEDPEISVDGLMKYIKGPDFPTGAQILGRESARAAYETGRGSVTIRAVAEIEPMQNGKSRIIVSEIPYQVNKARLIEKIAELVRERKIDGITDLRDETARAGIRIVMELRRDANANVVLNQLYKYTQMQQTFAINMLALVDGQPRVLNLREVIRHYLDHQKDVITRRTRFELERAEARAHILEGLKIALDNLDEVINTIRSSRTEEIARDRLMERFQLSDKQAKAIVDMRLGRLTGLEREKIEEEYAELTKTIEYLRAVLASEKMVYDIIKRELIEIRDKYGDDRRTRIVAAAEDFATEDLIPEEDVTVTVTHQGYIKRIPTATYRSQRRGGHGVTAMGTKEEDFLEHLFTTTTHQYLLCFTNQGRVHRLKVHEIPEAGRTARGTNIVNLLQLGPGEKITALVAVKEFKAGQYLFFTTRYGVVKRTDLAEFETSRRGGLIAITLDEGDELISAQLTSGKAEVLLITKQGQAIRFAEQDVRVMGRTAHGVKGITLDRDDSVVGAEPVEEGAQVLVVTDRGFGKRTPIEDYRLQSRGGKGIRTITLTRKNGLVAGFKMVRDGDEVMTLTAQGAIIRMSVNDIPILSRYAQGVTVMRFSGDTSIVAVAKVVSKEED